MIADDARHARALEYLGQIIDATSALAYLFPKSSPSRGDLLEAVALISRARDSFGQGGEEIVEGELPDPLSAKTRTIIAIARVKKELTDALGQKGGAEIAYRLADDMACAS